MARSKISTDTKSNKCPECEAEFTTKSNIVHKRMKSVFTFLLGPKLPRFLPSVFHLIVEEYGIFMGYVGYMRGPSLASQYCTQLAMVGIGKYR